MTRRLWPAALLAGLGIAILCGLGVWQLQRLAWKEDLLAAIAERMAKAPANLAEATGRSGDGGIEEFAKVRTEGRLIPTRSLFVISTFEGGAGWTVLTPLLTKDGFTVLVDRGTIPDGARGQILAEAERDETVTGIVRHRRTGRGAFDPDNDPVGNNWYWWDLPAMLTAAGGAPERSVPFILQEVPDGTGRRLPRPAPPEAGFRNTHLQYAVTWFGLAAALAAIAFLALRRARKHAA
jgi:surfeit locus 1 family protein